MSIAKLEDKAKKTFAEVGEILNSANIDNIQLNDITVRIGGRVVKFVKQSDQDYSLDKEIRDEYKALIQERFKSIGNVINEKINETLVMARNYQDEFTRKEQILQDKLAKTSPMPDVTMNHARKGLSVFKGDRSGEICWLVRSVYWPKFVDNNPIEPDYIAPYVTPIYIMVVTVDKKVTSVSTRRLAGLDLFPHYHQAGPDCWGQWKIPSSWNTPEDIISIANSAEAVLENINSRSIANNTPAGLPTIDNIKRHIKMSKTVIEDIHVSDRLERTGVRAINTASDDIWSAI